MQAEGSFDPRGRVIGLHGITIACTRDHQALWIGADLADGLAIELISAFDHAGPSIDPIAPPPALVPCRRILETGGRSLREKAGPNFVFTEDVQFRSELVIERSGASTGDGLRTANPGNWHPVEWDELLDGRLGPWAMALDGGRVASICHTPGPVSARVAECGVWTHPAFRGRGYAAAVTSAWAAIMRPSGRTLFYSTDAENRSSQRVAERLHLRPIGWTWRLGLAPDHEDPGIHPLSALRRRG